jgi:nucleotide-binding universal stress UspA family protein
MFPTKILLATDGSEDAKLAARTAADLAEKTDSELHVVYVGGEGFYEIPLVDNEVEQLEAAGGTVTQAHLSMGEAAPEIVVVAEEIDAGLIVMGSTGQGSIRRALLGSVSESVVKHAHCAVLIVRE